MYEYGHFMFIIITLTAIDFHRKHISLPLNSCLIYSPAANSCSGVKLSFFACSWHCRGLTIRVVRWL